MWFDGPVGNAIAKAKTEKHLLIIYVHGEDENSKRVSSYWENDEIRNVVKENSCVALKLTEGSEAAKQFGQIYPVVSIPISFFIVPNGGVPLEVLVQYESLDAFKEKLVKTIEAFKNSLALPEKGSAPETPRSNERPSSPEGNRVQASAAVGDDNQPSTTASLEDRVDRAQRLIRERQEQKAREAEENAREAEAKRREQGREFQRNQERLKEQEALKIAEERKKAKKEDKEHLNKLREQIAADRAEKAAKFSNVQEKQKQVIEEKKQQKVEIDERQRQEEEERRKRFALLQFRLPDGSALRNQFDGSAPFTDAEQWVAQEIQSAATSFQLVQMFPRREFTEQDRTRSLSDLGLTPNAVLIVLPNATGGQTYSGPKPGTPSTVAWLWGIVTAPLRYFLNFLYVFVFGSATAPRPVTGPATNANNPAGLNQPSTSKKDGPSTSTSGSGNVVRFRNAQDADKKSPDDNATWNGNSTQQL